MKKLITLTFLLFAIMVVGSAQTVTIGFQIWSAKNLNVSTFRNGDPIKQAKTDIEWRNANALKQPAWCYYNNDPANGAKYGKLYNWYAVNDPRGLAPAGWHIPSDAEWTTLIDNLDGQVIAGKRMKSTSGWKENANGTNTSGFSGLPSGKRDFYGGFAGIREFTSWWASTSDANFAWIRFLSYSRDYIGRTSTQKGEGFSVRCISDRSFVGRDLSNNKPVELISGQSSVQKSKQVSIGSQVWMTENLNVDKFRNGDPIPEAKTLKDIYKAENSWVPQPFWCYYNFDPKNEEKYGKLYNWAAVNDPRGLAPKGWHIPNYKEWTMLIDYLGGEKTAATKMKSTTGWEEEGNGTNSSGLSFLPGGIHELEEGGFLFIGSLGSWWSSTASNTSIAWYITMSNGTNVDNYDHGNKSNFYSVRCIKDKFIEK